MNFSAVGAAALGDRLYVCGGYDGITSLSTVECYHPDRDVWKLVPEMTKHRSAGGVVAFEGHIYALGGHDGLSIFDSVSISHIKTISLICCWLLFRLKNILQTLDSGQP